MLASPLTRQVQKWILTPRRRCPTQLRAAHSGTRAVVQLCPERYQYKVRRTTLIQSEENGGRVGRCHRTRCARRCRHPPPTPIPAKGYADVVGIVTPIAQRRKLRTRWGVRNSSKSHSRLLRSAARCPPAPPQALPTGEGVQAGPSRATVPDSSGSLKSLVRSLRSVRLAQRKISLFYIAN